MSAPFSANVADLFNAKGLVVVVTGGSSGLGLIFATTLAANGAAKVFILGRRTDKLEAAAKDIDAEVVIPVTCDVSKGESIAAAVKTIESHTEYVDVLVNNAGVLGPSHTKLQEAQSIEELSSMMLSQQDQYAGAFAINTTSVILVSGAFLPLLDRANVRRGWASGRRTHQRRERIPEGIDSDDDRSSQIITTASVASFNRFVTAGLAYGASKAGTLLLGKTMATFLAPFGIRSNVIAPGRFPSEMNTDTSSFPVDKIPHGVNGKPENMAACILSLVGKGGAYYNGDVRVIDGGRLSVMPATY